MSMGSWLGGEYGGMVCQPGEPYAPTSAAVYAPLDVYEQISNGASTAQVPVNGAKLSA